MKAIYIRRYRANNIIKGNYSYDWERMDTSLLTEWIIENSLKEIKETCYEVIKVDMHFSNSETFRVMHEGITIVDKNGNEEKFYFFLRSAGSAKNGTALFINRRLRAKAERFLNMEQKIQGKVDLTGLSVYRSLIGSGIKDTVRIHPHEIIICDDYEMKKLTKAIVVDADENGILRCHEDEIEVETSLFDGMGVIDYRLVEKYDGCVLLRNHFTKVNCLKVDLQKFYKDAFGWKTYETAKIDDIFGNTYFVKDIKLIICKSAVKWTKFEEFNYTVWHDAVTKNNCTWGIVKDGHDSKYGELGESNYQIINSLYPETIDKIADTSKDFLAHFGEYDNITSWLDVTGNSFNSKLALSAMLKARPEMLNTRFMQDYIKDRHDKDARQNIRAGRPFLNGQYMTVFGNPLDLMKWSLGVEPKGNFEQEDDAFQCYTRRFDFDTYLGGARSPHNSRNNLMAFHNVQVPEFEEYVHCGKNVIIVDMMTTVQARANGEDMDGDTNFVASNEAFVEDCRRAMREDLVVVNAVPNAKKLVTYNAKRQAETDYAIKESQNDIGSSSNLSQLAQTMYWITGEKKYYDYCCILAVVAQIAIDGAKKSFDCDIKATIKAIKNELPDEYPWWWNPVTGQNKSEDKCTLKDNASPIAKLRSIKWGKYNEIDKYTQLDDIICRGSLKGKDLTKTKKFVEEELMEACKKRFGARMEYFRALSKATTNNQKAEAKKHAQNEYDEILYDKETGIIPKLKKFWNQKIKDVPYMQYIIWKVLKLWEDGELDKRMAYDAIWLLYASVPDEKFAKAMEFNN